MDRVGFGAARGYEGQVYGMGCAAADRRLSFATAGSRFCGRRFQAGCFGWGRDGRWPPRDGRCWSVRGVEASTATQERVAQGVVSCRAGRAVRSLYDVLGVSKGATAQEIKLAYRQIARRVHPDVVLAEQRQDSTKSFLQIQNAYTTLSDPQKRAAYDLQLSLQAFQTFGYGFDGVAPLTTNCGFTVTPEPSFPQWKGRRWETDQCW